MHCLRLDYYEFSNFFPCNRLYRLEDTKRNVFGSHRVPKSSPLQKVSQGVGDRFILTDSVIIYTRFGSSQPPVSLEMTTIASLTRETSAITKIVTEKVVDLFIKYLLNPILCGYLPP